MAFDPTFPATDALLVSAEFRAQFNGLADLIAGLEARVAVLEAGAPSPPQNPSATLGAAGTGEVSFNWETVAGAVMYWVYNHGGLLGSFAAPPAALTLTPGAAFSLTVTAVNASGESGPSNVITDTAP